MIETASGDFLATYLSRWAWSASRSTRAARCTSSKLDSARTANNFWSARTRASRLWVGTGVGVESRERPSRRAPRHGRRTGRRRHRRDGFLAKPHGEVFLGTSSGFSHYVPRADAPRVDRRPCASRPWARRETRLLRLVRARCRISRQNRRVSGSTRRTRRRMAAAHPSARPRSALPPGGLPFEARARLRPGTWSAPGR